MMMKPQGLIMIIAFIITINILGFLIVYKRRSIDLEISAHVFKRKIPVRMTDTWKKDLNINSQKFSNSMVGNPEMIAYFIVENIQEYRRTVY
jgi:hypothetical protein